LKVIADCVHCYLKQAGIQVAHSEGFNPRPRIVFAQPLALGLTSDGEFADVALGEPIEIADFIQKINSALPAGISVIEAKVKTGKSNLMGIIDAARYRISFEAGDMPDIEYLINSVLDSSEINVMKRTKRGEKKVNIRPFIYDLSGEKDGRTGIFNVILAAGQNNNIRPELFLEGVSKVSNTSLDMLRMHRIMLYCSKKKHVSDLPSAGSIWITPMDYLLIDKPG
jgi:radical SAM-linked protein